MNIGFAITGSFCTHTRILEQIQKLKNDGHNILPIFSFSVAETDTRFGRAIDFRNAVVDITGNEPVSTIVGAEPIGPQNLIDVLIIAPCTGSTLAKLANAITDTPVTMVTKAHVRNNKPVVVGISTNDALGQNLANLAIIMNSKNFYVVPFRQDNPTQKPKSLISEYALIKQTLEAAIKGQQIQPIILSSEV